MYAWVGAIIGALIRSLGGKIADKLDSSIVTQFVSIVMVLSAVNVGYYA
jgi:NNP family nitrate/nitrite transporter-like MFS transporter|tara:strand:+ start:3481 stop:3627 length:147 start_codon:yes stop_codon:yes gene_type:complete